MPKYRQLHTKLVDSLDVAAMPDDFTRLFYITLIVILDSEGRAIDNPAWLRSKAFPLREDVELKQINAAMDWFAKRGLIIRYKVEGNKYFYCPSFLKLQSGLNKELVSSLPEPPEEPFQNDSVPTPEPLQSDSAPMQGNTIQDNSNQGNADDAPIPFPIVTKQNRKPEPYSHDWMLNIWTSVTGFTSFTGDHGKIIDALEGLRYRRTPQFQSEKEIVDYLSPYFTYWCGRKGKNGVPYSKRNPAWLDMAVAGDPLPTDKKPPNAKPDPDCPVCGGMGLYRKDLDVHDPNFGKLTKCECVKVREEVDA
jgi:hypothetical protein